MFQKNKFTIKRTDKKNNTLKGLAPTKRKKIKVIGKKVTNSKNTVKRKTTVKDKLNTI